MLAESENRIESQTRRAVNPEYSLAPVTAAFLKAKGASVHEGGHQALRQARLSFRM